MTTDNQPLKGTILVVDDTPANLQLLSAELTKAGYKVRLVPDGRLALAGVKSNPPDLILLDIMMPGIDGYEVCAKLKEDEQTRNIPVIFISALDEALDKEKAFMSGGVDYVTKPFQFREVHARVQVHLQLKQAREHVEQLGEMKDNLVRMIVHDLRNPLSSVHLALSCLGDPPNAALLGQDMWAGMRNQINYGLEMCEQLLDITKLENNSMSLKLTKASLKHTVVQASSSVELQAKLRNVNIVLDCEDVDLETDHDLIRRILINLISNASKYAPADSDVVLTGSTNEDQAYLTVRDEGKGIPAEYHNQIFELFGSAEIRNEARGAGIGLAFCKLAVDALKGTIEVESQIGAGTKFIVQFPRSMS